MPAEVNPSMLPIEYDIIASHALWNEDRGSLSPTCTIKKFKPCTMTSLA
jgi:hypothetical protein